MNTLTFYKSVFSFRDVPSDVLPEICISGRSNVGKSSVINCLANRRKLAKTSQTPGKTRSLNYYQVDSTFFLVDLPGYGYAKISRTERQYFKELVNSYLKDRKELKGLIQLFDARHGPVGGDNMMLEWIREWGGSVLYIFTKTDKLSASSRAKLKTVYEKEYGLENIVMFSANTGTGKEAVWSWIYRTIGSIK